MSRIEELFQDIAEEFAQGNRQERELSRVNVDTSDLYKNDEALLTGLGTAATLPYAGPAWLGNFVTRAATPVVSKMYGAVGGDMVNQSIRNMGSKLPGSSGSRVGTDVAGRIPMPASKAPVPTNRGPRGPINIEQPAVTPKAPLPGTRNTGGVSETDQAMIKMQQAQMKPPQPPKEGIASMPQGRELERMNKRRNFLITKTRYDQSLIKANEAPSKDYARNLEELQRLEELFKGK
jgi:hypothetical protein|tara:strand:- start:774 stop:1478 length:705 start_codon:yes stop_codon:yes gene_type:complete